MADAPLFVYGTLMDPDMVAAVTGRRFAELAPEPATLVGFTVERAAGKPYPILVPCEGGRAKGLLLHGFSEGDMARLQAYETDSYTCADVTVETPAGPVAACVFLPTAALASSGEPWDFAAWQARHRAKAVATGRPE